jgi:hypothetical protein
MCFVSAAMSDLWRADARLIEATSLRTYLRASRTTSSLKTSAMFGMTAFCRILPRLPWRSVAADAAKLGAAAYVSDLQILRANGWATALQVSGSFHSGHKRLPARPC